MKVYLFYGTQLVDEFEPQTGSLLSRHIKTVHGQEIYNGGWIYAPLYRTQPYGWWKCDMTPCHIEHVPKELRALALLIT